VGHLDHDQYAKLRAITQEEIERAKKEEDSESASWNEFRKTWLVPILLILRKAFKHDLTLGDAMTLTKDGISCPHCGSGNLLARGWYKGERRYKCKDCTARSFVPPTQDTPTNESVVETSNQRTCSTTVPEWIVNEKQLASQCEIDLDQWRIDKWTCDKKETVARGEIHTTFQVKVWLSRSVEELLAIDFVNHLVEDAKSFAPSIRR
jgi:hypothetical protein